MSSRHHNPERRSWRGRSYRAAGRRIRDLRALLNLREEGEEGDWYDAQMPSSEWAEAQMGLTLR